MTVMYFGATFHFLSLICPVTVSKVSTVTKIEDKNYQPSLVAALEDMAAATSLLLGSLSLLAYAETARGESRGLVSGNE